MDPIESPWGGPPPRPIPLRPAENWVKEGIDHSLMREDAEWPEKSTERQPRWIVPGGATATLAVESKLNIISPNTPDSNLQVALPITNPPVTPPVTLYVNKSGPFNSDDTYRFQGDSAWIRFTRTWMPSDQSALLLWATSKPVQAYFEFLNARMHVANGVFDIPTYGGTQLLVRGWIEPLLVPWNDGITWNTQPLTEATAQDAAGDDFIGTSISYIFAHMENTMWINNDARDGTASEETFLVPLPTLSSIGPGFILAGPMTTALRINHYPFGYPGGFGGSPPLVQEYYNSHYNIAANFIGSTVKVIPWDIGSGGTRPVATSTVVDYLSDGTYILDPNNPLPYVPQSGIPDDLGATTDSVLITRPIYGLALRMYTLFKTVNKNIPIDGSFLFDDMDFQNILPSTGNT